MSNMLPMYNTKIFTDVWEDVNDFIYDYNQLPVSMKVMKQDLSSMTTLFYLLYSRYGNNPIANFDENQFKFKVFSIVFMYGPTWEKRLDIQTSLRALTEDDLLKGGKAIYNNAVNPGEAPTTSTLDELSYINQQNTTNYKKSKMDAYAQLWELLDNDVTSDFINKFKVCFKTVVFPEHPLLYVDEEDD